MASGQWSGKTSSGARLATRHSPLATVQQRLNDPLCGMAVAEGIDGVRHRGVGGGIIQQSLHFGFDPIGIGSHQARRPGLDRLRSLGHLPQDEHRLV